MRSPLTTALVPLCISCLAAVSAYADGVTLVVTAGTPLRIAIDDTIALTRIGQEIHGTLVEPVYAYDRLVLPAGARVTGHVASLETPTKGSRFKAWSAADFSPHRQVTVRFDRIVDDDLVIALDALGTRAIANVRRQHAEDPAKSPLEDDASTSLASRTKQELRQKVRAAVTSAKARADDELSLIKAPGKKERLKYLLVNQLPYHPQYLSKGTVYDAELVTDLSFGTVDGSPVAPNGTHPAPLSVLRARIVTPLDSATARKGSPVQAVVTQPVRSSDGSLIFPQGTRLVGEVTAATPARRFHRNGQLRFLFERVERPDQTDMPLLASLHSADVSADERIGLDEEGGAAIKDSKTRFIAPSLAALALRGSLDHHEHLDPDGDGHMIRSGHPGAMGTGGFLGVGAVGAIVGPMWRPAGIAFSLVGVARTTYKNILGRGQEVRFAEDTPIELQLAPGPSPAP
jgi:hypothetical protein